jgi:hypothetical protein
VKTSCGEPLAVTVVINAHTPLVRELKASLSALIGKLQALGPLAFDMAPEIVAQQHPKEKAAAAKQGRRPGRRSPRSHHHR